MERVKKSYIDFLFVFTIGWASFLNASGFLKVQGTAIVDSSGQELILRGFGLGGWLVQEGYQIHTPMTSPSDIQNKIYNLIGAEAAERFYQSYVQNYVSEADIEKIASWGFNSIRLPFHYRMFEPEGQAGIRPEDPFAFLDRVVGWCGKYGLHLIFDMHCAPGGQNGDNISDSDGTARLWTDPANRDKTVAIWRRIAERYADEPWVAGYDLLNEPVLPSGHSNAELRSLYVRIAQTIREVDNNHMLFIEGNWYATDFADLTPPFDSNLVYSFHKYWNENSQASIQTYLNLRTQSERPIWLGESGENSNAWFAACVRLLEQNNIGWNWWTHKKVETLTSPYSARISSKYQIILNYWEGNGSRPSAASAEAGLLDMAGGLQIERCEFRPDVVDALILQPNDTSVRPFKNCQIPGMIAAVDYDFGGVQTAYSDKVAQNMTGNPTLETYWNSGGKYRNDGADIETSGDITIPYNVGWIETGEWLQYTAEVPGGGVFDAVFSVASASSSGKLRMLMDGVPLFADVIVPNTGGWKQWQTVSDTGVVIPSGTHAFRLDAVQGGFNCLSIEFKLRRPSNVRQQGTIPVPALFSVGHNYPNPFNSSTTILFHLTEAQNVTVKVFNPRGECVRILNDGWMEAGMTEMSWDGKNGFSEPVPSGVYLYTVQSAAGKKMFKAVICR
jgi:endoglucanase